MAYQHAAVRATPELSYASDTWAKCTYTGRVGTLLRGRVVIKPHSECFISAQWGFHPGGWGKPPLDEYNRPLYGDVFGVLPKVTDINVSGMFRKLCSANYFR